MALRALLAASISLTFVLVGCTEDPYEASTGEAPPNASVRVVNEVEDAATIDFCVKGSGPWLGPVMHTLLQQVDGLEFDGATGYLSITEGDYIARLSDPTLGLCFPPQSPEEFELSLKANTRYTATVAGKLEPAAGEDPVSLTMHED